MEKELAEAFAAMRSSLDREFPHVKYQIKIEIDETLMGKILIKHPTMRVKPLWRVLAEFRGIGAAIDTLKGLSRATDLEQQVANTFGAA